MTATPELAYVYLRTSVSVEKEGRLESLLPTDVQGRDVAHVITAWNPGDERPDGESNAAADERLREELRHAGLAAVRARGADPSSAHFEDGWFVRGLSDDEARSIGADYGQVAIFRFSNALQTVMACAEEWSVSRSLHQISVDDVVAGHNDFNAGGLATWRWFVDRAPGGPSLEQSDDRFVLFTFLNRWGCRLKRGVGGSPSLTEESLESWWTFWGPALAHVCGRPLESLSLRELELVADAYWDLRCRPASTQPHRSLGPTAASKVLLALSPETFPAWDKTIAKKLYGGTSRSCYLTHLVSSACWSAALRDEPRAMSLIDPEARVGMGKLIDQVLYRFVVRTGGDMATTLNG
jgi:hypothetical protein